MEDKTHSVHSDSSGPSEGRKGDAHAGARMLADVLWEAANVHLWDGMSEYDPAADRIPLDRPSPPRKYSCDALFSVTQCRERSAVEFVESFGVNIHSPMLDDIEEGEERQAARYMWLLLAMHVAEDEGIQL